MAAAEEDAAAGWEGVASLQGSVRRELGGGCELRSRSSEMWWDSSELRRRTASVALPGCMGGELPPAVPLTPPGGGEVREAGRREGGTRVGGPSPASPAESTRGRSRSGLEVMPLVILAQGGVGPRGIDSPSALRSEP